MTEAQSLSFQKFILLKSGNSPVCETWCSSNLPVEAACIESSSSWIVDIFDMKEVTKPLYYL